MNRVHFKRTANNAMTRYVVREENVSAARYSPPCLRRYPPPSPPTCSIPCRQYCNSVLHRIRWYASIISIITRTSGRIRCEQVCTAARYPCTGPRFILPLHPLVLPIIGIRALNPFGNLTIIKRFVRVSRCEPECPLQPTDLHVLIHVCVRLWQLPVPPHPYDPCDHRVYLGT